MRVLRVSNTPGSAGYSRKSGCSTGHLGRSRINLGPGRIAAASAARARNGKRVQMGAPPVEPSDALAPDRRNSRVINEATEEEGRARSPGHSYEGRQRNDCRLRQEPDDPHPRGPCKLLIFHPEGKVKLTVVSKQGKEAVVAILGTATSSERGVWQANYSEWQPRPPFPNVNLFNLPARIWCVSSMTK